MAYEHEDNRAQDLKADGDCAKACLNAAQPEGASASTPAAVPPVPTSDQAPRAAAVTDAAVTDAAATDAVASDAAIADASADDAAALAHDEVKVISVGDESKPGAGPAARAARAQTAQHLSQAQAVLSELIPMLTDLDRGRSVLASLLAQSAEAGSELVDGHGQPLGSMRAPDPTSDGFYHDLLQLKAQRLFIDKTDYLSSYLATPRFDLITRPLGMGKTVLLKTIAALYSGRQDVLPSHLAVLSDWSEPQYEVIYLDFAQLCYPGLNIVRHSYPTTEELIAGPYICGTDILNRRRSQGLIAHMAEYEYQYYHSDSFATNVYDQLYQQCTRSFDSVAIKEVQAEGADVGGCEDFSGILSHTVDRIALLQIIRLLSHCAAASRVLIIDNFDAPLLSAMHLPECYNQRASFLARFLLLLTQHGQAFHHILISAQCGLPELGWQPSQDGVVINSALNQTRWHSAEFAPRLGFTLDELKAQVPREIKERQYDYLSLSHSLSDEDAMWDLFAQNFGGYSFDRKTALLLPRLVIAQLRQPSSTFNPNLTYGHGEQFAYEAVEAMPDLDLLYLHTISRLPFESFIRFFNTVLRGRCYASPDPYQLPLSIPGYPDQIPGRDKTDFSANSEDDLTRAIKEQLTKSEPSAKDLEHFTVRQAQPEADSASKAEPEAEPEAATTPSAPKLEVKSEDQDASISTSTSAATAASAPVPARSEQPQPAPKRPARRRTKAQPTADAAGTEAAQDRIGAILGFGDQVESPLARLKTPSQMMLEEFVKHIHSAHTLLPKEQEDQTRSLDYSKVQQGLNQLNTKAQDASLEELARDVDLVGYFEDSEARDSSLRDPSLRDSSKLGANKLHGPHRLKVAPMSQELVLRLQTGFAGAPTGPHETMPPPNILGSDPQQDAAQLTEDTAGQVADELRANHDRTVAMEVLKKQRALENNVLKAAYAQVDARAEGGFPAVSGADLEALERLTQRVQTGPTGAQIDEDESRQLIAELQRLDLMRSRVARSRYTPTDAWHKEPFELVDLLRALGFLTLSRERSIPNLDLVPNRYVYRKLRSMVLSALFRADCPLNNKSEAKLTEALGRAPGIRLEVEYDFSHAQQEVERMRQLFNLAGLGALFQTVQGKRSTEDLRMELGDLPDLVLYPSHFFPVKKQAPVYVPLLTNIINWISVPGPITLSANAINEAVALFCQLHMMNSEDLALGRDIMVALWRVDELEEERQADEQQFRAEIENAARAAHELQELRRQEAAQEKATSGADAVSGQTASGQAASEQTALSEQALSEQDAQSAQEAAAAAAAAAAPKPEYKSPAAAYGLFIYDEDTERDYELEAQALAQQAAHDVSEAHEAALAPSAQQSAQPASPALPPTKSAAAPTVAESGPQAVRTTWDHSTERLLQRANDLAGYDERWRGVNFSTRPIEPDKQAQNVVSKALEAEDFDLSQALLEVASAQVRRHHNLTIYTPGSAIVIELALAKSEEQLQHMTSLALHNLVRVESPLLAALNKTNPYELETTQVQRVLLVGLVQERRIVVRKVLVVDVNQPLD